MHTLGEGITDTITGLLSDPPCKECIILREWLEQERGKREYYEQLLLTKAGIIRSNEVEDAVEYPTVHRISTMSSLRRMAQAEMIKASQNKKPEAVKKFEDALNDKG